MHIVRRGGTAAAMTDPEDFAQLALRCNDPIQYRYQVIWGIMLAEETVAERSRITGVDRGTVVTASSTSSR